MFNNSDFSRGFFNVSHGADPPVMSASASSAGACALQGLWDSVRPGLDSADGPCVLQGLWDSVRPGPDSAVLQGLWDSVRAGPDSAVLQGLWDSVRLGQEQVLRSPYLPACLAFLTHLLLSVPFFLLDVLSGVVPQIGGWRTAPAAGSRRWLRCLGRLALRYLTVVLPATALLQLALRSPDLPLQAPPLHRLCVEVLSCFLLFDALFFIWHFSMHRFPRLYRAVHQQHHRNQAMFALAAQDASGLELLSLLVLALVSARTVGCHPLSEALFHFLNSWLAVEDHCGYDLPWGLHRLLPALGLGGAPFHQLHHAKHSGNYAPYFTHWDRLFGTYRT